MTLDRKQGNPKDLHCILTFAGKVLDVTPVEKSLSWTTLALGGFGSLSFTLPGWLTREKIPYLANVKLYWGDLPLWEGRVEDLRYTLGGDSIETVVQCFGYQRLLDDVGVVRSWLKRDMNWRPTPGGDGTAMNPGSGTVVKSTNIDAAVGQYDPTDLTKSGLQLTGKGVAVPSNGFNGFDYFAGNLAVFRMMFLTLAYAGPNVSGIKMAGAYMTSNGAAFGASLALGPTGTYDNGLNAAFTDVNRIRIGMLNNSGGALTPTSADIVQWSKLGFVAARTSTPAATREDTDDGTNGGYYGGSILTDLISLVPGLAAGVIEQGTDFLISAITADVRRVARDVLNEVTSYYSREWAVWEDARLDWKTPNLEEPQWILDIQDLSGMQLDTTLDDLAVTEYILYTDAVSDWPLEASAVSSDQRNPFAKAGQQKDVLTTPGFQMTTGTSAQLAARLAATRGQYPTVAGTISLPMMAIVDRVSGQARPAAAIRAGENVLIPALPKSDPFTQGRDGQTLFHIVSTNANAEDGMVTLEVEGFTKTQDALMAKLAAVTRNLTG